MDRVMQLIQDALENTEPGSEERKRIVDELEKLANELLQASHE